jgi:calcium-dependent protein kinase
VTEPHYVSPEVLTGNYNEKCDIWSAGVILFIMLAGYPPIHDDDKDALYQKILTYKPVTDGEEWKTVSEAAKDLIRKMLVAPDQRLDSDGVLAHPWMNNQADSFKREKTLLSINYTKLNGFINHSKFKRACLHYLASQLTPKDIDRLEQDFLNLDLDRDGEINYEEFLLAVQKKIPDPEDIRNLFDAVDIDQSGSINYTEFVASLMNQSVYLKEEKLYQAFKMFDKNNDGFISAEEIKAVLGSRRRSPR